VTLSGYIIAGSLPQFSEWMQQMGGSGSDLHANLTIISLKLKGIEWLFAVALYLTSLGLLSFWLERWLRRFVPQSVTIEIYVPAAVVLTIACWWWPAFPFAVFCSYLSANTVHVLLSVVFLSKAVGNIESSERSLILFILNVIQIVFMFAIWYERLQTGRSQLGALFDSLMVFGTLGYPNQAHVVVGIQVATDFLLLAIFLSYLEGGCVA
jgi:hypothetical protein